MPALALYPEGTLFRIFNDPLPQAMKAVVGENSGWLHMLVWIGLFGLVASFHGIILGYSRQFFALARAGYLPPALAKLSRFHTPHRAIIAGGLFGAAWAFIPAWLQAKRGSHIVITTIMFNFIAASLMAYLLVDVFKPPGSMATESKVFAVASWLPKMSELAAGFGVEMPNSPLNISFVWALICAALVWVFIWHTRWGYEIRSVGASQSASAYAGISYPKVVILAMVISGMLAGFFALNVLQGELHQIKLNFVEGFGFTGIAVALMGRNHPVGVIIASLLFGFLYQGGAELSFEFGVDRNIVVVLQGLVILFCGALEHMLRPRIEQAYLAFANRSTAQVKGV